MMVQQGLILVGNIIHSAGAQDLLLQTLTEWQADLAVVSEPYHVPESANWVSYEQGTVALHLCGALSPALHLRSGNGFVIACWGEIIVAEVYALPSCLQDAFENMLSDLDKGMAKFPVRIFLLVILTRKASYGAPIEPMLEAERW